jgi:hypothetical protein
MKDLMIMEYTLEQSSNFGNEKDTNRVAMDFAIQTVVMISGTFRAPFEGFQNMDIASSTRGRIPIILFRSI